MTRAQNDPRGYKLLQVTAWATFLAVFLTGLTFGYWRFFDPILPKMETIEANITEITPGSWGSRTYYRVFKVVRVIDVGEDITGALSAKFERDPSGTADDPTVGDGVHHDPIQISLSEVPAEFKKGRHQRERRWETAGLIEPGHYVYTSTFRACNPARCREHTFPPVGLMVR